MLNFKTSIAAALVSIGALCTGTAHAGNVQWSVGINLPVVTPYYPAPVYAPAPVYVPPPVYVRPAPVVVYQPAPVYAPHYYPPRVIRDVWVPPGYGHRPDFHGRDRWDDRRDHRGDGRRDDHWHR
jgi:hypothetical protein